MQYVAFLRGINVGGNNIIKMDALREVCRAAGFQNVTTYIQSGNVLFSSPETREKVQRRLEKALLEAFSYKLRIMLRTFPEMKSVVLSAPSLWNTSHDFRCYVAYTWNDEVQAQLMEQLELRPDVDFAESGPGVVYLTTRMEGLTKSKLSKLIGKKVFQDVTIRNFATTKKVLQLLNVV